MMQYFLGIDYRVDEIREAIGTQLSGEEVPMVQPIF